MNGTAKTFFSSATTGAIGLVTTRRRQSGPSSQHDTMPEDTDTDTDARVSDQQQGGSFLEDCFIIFGLVFVQVISAIYVVSLGSILKHGLKPLFLVIFSCTATSVLVLPFAIVFEAKKWPSKLTSTMIIQFLLIALGGVTAFQAFMLMGIEKTSPALASAMPNIAPGIIFIIAACLRFEKVDIRCKYTRAKILGTFICLGGAITMSLLQGPGASSPIQGSETSSLLSTGFRQDETSSDWIIGCLYLLAAVLVVSCSTVLQAATMIHFPAPFSLCAITSFLGALLTVILQIIIEGKVDMGSPIINLGTICLVLLLGGMVIALCVSFQTWAVKKKGPVLVSMFSPIQTVCTTILSAAVFGQVVKQASLAGMLIMFSGLYIVLWAKKKEGAILSDNSDNSTQLGVDVEKPLLSESSIY